MERKIEKLDENVINRIAAGEVRFTMYLNLLLINIFDAANHATSGMFYICAHNLL